MHTLDYNEAVIVDQEFYSVGLSAESLDFAIMGRCLTFFARCPARFEPGLRLHSSDPSALSRRLARAARYQAQNQAGEPQML